MKAIQLEGIGGTESLIIKDVAMPNIQKGEVLVKVKSFSINPVDIKTRIGKGVHGRIKDEQPIILGWDVSGEVIEIANDVTKFKKGDQVFGMINFPGHGKAYAEYVSAPALHLALKPKNTSHENAAAATLAALTAWQSLVHVGKIKKGDRLLVHAAAGGVGHYAVQIAKYFGAYVVGTASTKNHAFLKELGIDEAIDYTKQDFESNVKDIDILLDPIGGDTTKRSYSILNNGGRLISIVGGVKEEDKDLVSSKNIQAQNYLVQSNGDDMEAIASLLQSENLKSTVSKIFSLQDIAEAHKHIETGRTTGKVVISLQ